MSQADTTADINRPSPSTSTNDNQNRPSAIAPPPPPPRNFLSHWNQRSFCQQQQQQQKLKQYSSSLDETTLTLDDYLGKNSRNFHQHNLVIRRPPTATKIINHDTIAKTDKIVDDNFEIFYSSSSSDDNVDGKNHSFNHSVDHRKRQQQRKHHSLLDNLNGNSASASSGHKQRNHHHRFNNRYNRYSSNHCRKFFYQVNPPELSSTKSENKKTLNQTNDNDDELLPREPLTASSSSSSSDSDSDSSTSSPSEASFDLDQVEPTFQQQQPKQPIQSTKQQSITKRPNRLSISLKSANSSSLSKSSNQRHQQQQQQLNQQQQQQKTPRNSSTFWDVSIK